MLTVQESFLSGVSRLFDFTRKDKCNINAEDPDAQDFQAIRKDWETVGSDMWSAIYFYKQKEDKNAEKGRYPDYG